MTTKNLFRLMAMMLIGVATMCMTSCKQDDPAKDAWILGKWYMEKDKHGTLGEGDAALEYEKVVLCGEFKSCISPELCCGLWSIQDLYRQGHCSFKNGKGHAGCGCIQPQFLLL